MDSYIINNDLFITVRVSVYDDNDKKTMKINDCVKVSQIEHIRDHIVHDDSERLCSIILLSGRELICFGCVKGLMKRICDATQEYDANEK